MNLKDLIRSTLNKLHLDLTKNLEYDRLTKKVMKRHLTQYSNCIDVGCHKGEILDLIIKISPKGKHFAFEPIPQLFSFISEKYGSRAEIFPYALSNQEGKTTFNYVRNAPAYSGLKKRQYEVKNPDIEEIDVEIRTLDSIIPEDVKIDLIKIDVEGAELGVLQGGINTIKKNKTLIIFEFGLGASDFYGSTPKDIYQLLVENAGLKIYTLSDWLKNKIPLDLSKFSDHFNNKTEYYFIAV